MRFKQSPSDILKEIGIHNPEDIDLELVAFHLNAEVRLSPLSSYEGQIIGTDTRAIITIDDQGHPLRQKFSLGHELGHWVNDRGKNLTYRCTTDDMRSRWSKKNTTRRQVEARANAFSAQLLMPDHILPRYLDGLDITASSVGKLANMFQVSRTSMAIRFVEKNDFPCMLICWHKSGARKWFTSNSTIPENIWPHKYVLSPSTVLTQSDGVEVDADKWISGEYSENYTIVESVFNNSFDWFALIWWIDESQLTTY